MFSLPSFLTAFPFTLPSLPTISLPANIQRRFLSYVLKRTLGRFVSHQALDAERIQAQVSEGWVEIENLEIECSEINSYIPPSLPLSLTSGTLNKLTAKLPFPNLWSDPLQVSLDTLTLDFTLSSPSPLSRGRTATRPEHHDLAESVTSAADDFLHHELDAYEEKELEGSIRQSLILSQSDPFISDVPGGFPLGSPGELSPGQPLPANMESTTVLAGMVERILARLEFRVEKINIRLVIEDGEGVVELTVGRIQYADESEAQTDGDGRSTTRAIRISNISLGIVPSQHKPTFRAIPQRQLRLASVSSSNSTASISPRHDCSDMFMSQAVVDLRQSLSAPEQASEPSNEQSVHESNMFYSALSQPNESEPGASTGTKRLAISQDPKLVGEVEEEGSRSATPMPETKPQPSSIPVLSFGQEDVVLRMRTSRSLISAEHQASSNNNKPSVEVNISMGTIAAVLLPSHLRLLISALQTVQALSQKENVPAGKDKPAQSTSPQTRLAVTTKLKAFYLSLVYDLSIETSLNSHSTMASYLTRPSNPIPYPHLRFRLDTLVASYQSSGHSNPSRPAFTRPISGMSTANLRRKSSGHARFGLPPSSLTVDVGDIFLFEWMNEGIIAPVILFDPGLKQQYDLPSAPPHKGREGFPEFECRDWREEKKTGGEKAWRVRPRGKGILKGGARRTTDDEGPVIHIRQDLGGDSAAVINLQPLHVFVDLSLIERLLPLLRSVTPLIHPPEPTPAWLQSVPSQSIREEVTPESIISSLSSPPPTAGGKKMKSDIRCGLVRLSVRCPAPPPEPAERQIGDGRQLRSGIVCVDVHGLRSRFMDTKTGTLSASSEVANVEFGQTLIFFASASQRYAYPFLIFAPLSPEPGEEDIPLLPSISLSSLPQASSLPSSSIAKTTLVTCKMPAIRASVHHPTITGLQYFADDVTRWLDVAFADGSAKPRDELKMIGSRFFGGSKGSEASSEIDEPCDVEEVAAGMKVEIEINEIDMGLYVPRLDISGERVFSFKASDLGVQMETHPEKNQTALELSIMDLDFSDVSSTPLRILGRTTPFTLTSHQAPIVYLRFVSSTDLRTTLKESNISIALSHFTFAVHKEIAWLHEIAQFVKPPKGVFENLSPTDLTRLTISLSSASFLLVPPNLPGSIVILVREVEGKTEIPKGATDSILEVGMSGLGALAVEGESGPLEVSSDLADVWKKAGYAQLAEVMILELRLMRELVGAGEVSLDITQAQFKVTACADSLATFAEIATDFGRLFPNKKEEHVKLPSMGQSINVFDSLDENAFNLLPEIVSHSDTDMIEDDLPHNLDYLDHTTHISKHYPSMDRTTGESLNAWHTPGEGSEKGEWGNGESGETIRAFGGKIEEEKGYWEGLPILNDVYSADQKPGKTHIRIIDASLKIFLHDGYDWPRTRKAIEDEVRAVRRRLERIRQLLASGQKADESIENATSSVLFNSVYIGLEQKGEMGLSRMGMGKMDEKALMAAIDEELDDMETESGSSWQTLPAGVGAGPSAVHQAHKKTRLKGKRLIRSKKAQIEITLSGIKADVDLYPIEESTSSRIHFTAKEMEILDHIKTSTWKKFLTEMKADNRGNIRETDADMLRIELVGVRLKEDEEELRLRAKILPLRLHVDQDALDFLKRFFSFKAPPMASAKPLAQNTTSSTPDLYFQHVEIFPIQLKLDYKPKRIDFRALREGKTIELMNFFHFEGAEMTLRHITLSGITGLERLGTTLQDLWTPDVKANQLADVISGVSPIRSMVNVGSGVADLILLPIEQYRKDGRIAKGVQRGTNSFVKSTALEVMKLGARLATGTQVILERAEGVLGGKSGEDVVGQVQGLSTNAFGVDSGMMEGGSSSEDEQEVISRYADQPEGMREGVQAAYKSLSKNVNAAAQTILAVPMEVYERSGDDGPLKAVVRAVPIAVLKPMIGTTEAVSKTLLGMRNSLDPSARRELDDKYK
ncbi:hypothetical protein C366_00940 [Cryptococcus neoformans Tu401-1]|nr:hypothetical protein C366_00940 [Cryptococcus neoformans var. grubii Tu401-1]OXM81390.1 hypothetical protein C364_00943 [Cryptococcus neoformans var. grubii Bt63]